MLDPNTNSSDTPSDWNFHILPGGFSLLPTKDGVRFDIITRDEEKDDDDVDEYEYEYEYELPKSWKLVGERLRKSSKQ